MMIHETVITKSKLPESCIVHPYVVIGEHVKLGENVVIHPFVVINDFVEIGDNVEIFSGACIGKEPKGAGAISRKLAFDRFVKIGSNCSIGPHAVIYYDVSIGADTLIADGASIREQCQIGVKCVISRYVTVNYNTKIGNGTKIMDMTHITGNCHIGNNVFISLHVGMANDNNMGKKGYSEDFIKGPIIEDDVVVGLGSMLLPGIRIGRGAIVSSASCVRKNVEAHMLVSGNPAKALKKLKS